MFFRRFIVAAALRSYRGIVGATQSLHMVGRGRGVFVFNNSSLCGVVGNRFVVFNNVGLRVGEAIAIANSDFRRVVFDNCDIDR